MHVNPVCGPSGGFGFGGGCGGLWVRWSGNWSGGPVGLCRECSGL